MKIRLRRTDANGLRHAIRIAYDGDKEMPAIHILGSNATLEEMVEYTWQQSTGDAEKAGTKFYEIITPAGVVIGYTTLVISAKLLFTFAINVNYRRKEVLWSWLRAVERHLGYFFVLTLRPNNRRAINFFMNNGFTTQESPNQVALWRHQQ